MWNLKSIHKQFNFKIFKMKKTRIITTLLISCSFFLNGCMTTWPIVDDLDHYKKWDTYESIREEREQSETIIESEQEEMNEDVQEEIVEDEQDEVITNDEENSEDDEWENLEENL